MKHQFFQLLTFKFLLLFIITSFAATALAKKSARYPDTGTPGYIVSISGNTEDESAFVSSDLYSEEGLFYSKSEEGYPVSFAIKKCSKDGNKLNLKRI
jgi:hypothetical protein